MALALELGGKTNGNPWEAALFYGFVDTVASLVAMKRPGFAYFMNSARY